MQMQKIIAIALFLLSGCSNTQPSVGDSLGSAIAAIKDSLTITLCDSTDTYSISIIDGATTVMPSRNGVSYQLLNGKRKIPDVDLTKLKVEFELVGPFVFSPDRRLLAVGIERLGPSVPAAAGTVGIVELATNNLIATYSTPGKTVDSIAWAPSGDAIAILQEEVKDGAGLQDAISRIGGHPVPYVSFDLALITTRGEKQLLVPVAKNLRYGFGGLVWQKTDQKKASGSN